MKIAIIIEDSIYNRKGMMNAQLNRINNLLKIANYSIDVYSFQIYSGWFYRKLKGQNKIERPNDIEIDGIKINLKWRKFSLIDYILMKIIPIL